MESLLCAFGMPEEESRYEELNNWYTWVHMYDAMETGSGAMIACQRFELADEDIQPSDADTDYPFLALYELKNRAAMAKDRPLLFTWKLPVSTSYYKFMEMYWNIVYGSADFAEYAGAPGEQAVLTVRVKAEPGESVTDILTKERIAELGEMSGNHCAILFACGEDPEIIGEYDGSTHLIICRVKNTIRAAASWDRFAEKYGLREKLVTRSGMFVPVMDRIFTDDYKKTSERRAIAQLSKMILRATDTEKKPK